MFNKKLNTYNFKKSSNLPLLRHNIYDVHESNVKDEEKDFLPFLVNIP